MSESPSPSQFPNLDLAESIEAAKHLVGLPDISRVAEKESKDKLTGLLKKETWRLKLEEALRAQGDKAVLFIDLTNFKRINDEDPDKHQAGDMVLRKVASVLRKSFRLPDHDAIAHERHYESHGEAGRLGGDEFAVLLDLTPKTDEWQGKTAEERMQVVIDRLSSGFTRMKEENPLLSQYGFDVAIGGAVWELGMDAHTLLANADHAMQANKAEQHEEHGKYR